MEFAEKAGAVEAALKTGDDEVLGIAEAAVEFADEDFADGAGVGEALAALNLEGDGAGDRGLGYFG